MRKQNRQPEGTADCDRALEEEMTIAAQEFHLCQALFLHGEAVVALVQQGDGAVYAGQAVV